MPRVRNNEEIEVEEANVLPVMNIMFLLIPALLLAMEVASMAAIAVSPPKFAAAPAEKKEEEKPEEKPLKFKVFILDDGSRVIVAGPAIFEPAALPTLDKPVILQRATHATASKAFNPAPPAALTIRTLPSIARELVPASQRKIIYLIRHGESKWNEGKR